MVNKLSIAVYVAPILTLTSLSVDALLLPTNVEWFDSFRGYSFICY